MNRLTKVNIFVICIFSLFVVSIFCHSKINIIENNTNMETSELDKPTIINLEIENRVKDEIQNLNNEFNSKTNLLGFCSIFETSQDIDEKKRTIKNYLKNLLDEIQKIEDDKHYVYDIEITSLESSENQNDVYYSYTIIKRKDNIPHATNFSTEELNSILKEYVNNNFFLRIKKDFRYLTNKDELHNVMKVCSSQSNRRRKNDSSNSICNPNVQNEINNFQFPTLIDLPITKSINKNINTEEQNSQTTDLGRDVVESKFNITMFGGFERTNCGDFTLDISTMNNDLLKKYKELYGDENKRDMPYIKKEYTFHSCCNSIPCKLQDIINNSDNGVDSNDISLLIDACNAADSQLNNDNEKLYIKVSSTGEVNETNIRYALGLQEKNKFLSNGKNVYYDFYTLKTHDITDLYTLTIYRRSNCHYIPPKALSFDNQKSSRAHGHNIDSTES